MIRLFLFTVFLLKIFFCFPLFLTTCDLFRVHYEVSVPATKYVRSLYGDSQQAEPLPGAVKHNDNYVYT